MLIYLIRHASPHGVEGICYGRCNVPVHANETARAAQAVRQRLPEPVLKRAPIYSSPLVRCSMLAQQIADGRGVALTPALLELDFGDWQGRSWDVIPKEELDAWAADLWHYPPGRGENAEAVARRWRAWVDSLVRQSLEAVIAVTHAGVIRVAHAVEFSLRSDLLTMPVAYGSVHRIHARSCGLYAPRLERVPV